MGEQKGSTIELWSNVISVYLIRPLHYLARWVSIAADQKRNFIRGRHVWNFFLFTNRWKYNPIPGKVEPGRGWTKGRGEFSASHAYFWR